MGSFSKTLRQIYDKDYAQKEYLPAFHCLPLTFLKQDIKRGEIAFSSIRNWEDKYESSFLDCPWNDDFCGENVACICFASKANENQAASWEFRKKKSKHKYVQACFDLRRFLDLLESWAKEKKARIFVRKVKYLNGEARDKMLAKIPPKSKFKLDNYIDLLSIKRESFKFENEVRVFIFLRGMFKKREKKELHKAQLYKVPMDELKTLVKKITLEPFTSDKIDSGKYPKKPEDDKEIEKVKVFVDSHISPRIDLPRFVQRSRLYEYPRKINWDKLGK